MHFFINHFLFFYLQVTNILSHTRTIHNTIAYTNKTPQHTNPQIICVKMYAEERFPHCTSLQWNPLQSWRWACWPILFFLSRKAYLYFSGLQLLLNWVIGHVFFFFQGFYSCFLHSRLTVYSSPTSPSFVFHRFLQNATQLFKPISELE